MTPTAVSTRGLALIRAVSVASACLRNTPSPVALRLIHVAKTDRSHAMTDIKVVPQSSMDADTVAGVAQFLGPVVLDLTALAVDGKQAHWHVRGANFQAVHE